MMDDERIVLHAYAYSSRVHAARRAFDKTKKNVIPIDVSIKQTTPFSKPLTKAFVDKNYVDKL